MSKNPKNRWKSLKITNIDRVNLDIFWTTWGISIKYSGKIWLMIILEVTKIQGFTLSLDDAFLERPQLAVLGLKGWELKLVGNVKVSLTA